MTTTNASFTTTVFVGLLAVSAGAAAQTITVNISSDVIDVDWQTATIEDLPGPDGNISFSEAMIAANNTPGHQTIGFAIPQSDWTLQFVYPGRAVLRASGGGFFFRANDEITIDGTTQTAFTGDTNPDGAEITIYGSALYLNADNSTLVGFDSIAANINGSDCLVENNTGTMNITVYGGSGSVIRNNIGGTIKIDRSNNNIVIGNIVTRVRVLGWVGGGQPATNNRVGGPTLAERNYITGYGTWDGEGFPGGTTVQIFDSLDTLIENNWIGTTPDGMAQGSLASVVGVGLEGENYNTIVRNNRIAGILGHGIGPHADGLLFGSAVRIYGTGDGFTLTGNTIGLNANDEPVLGSVTGVTADNYYLGPVQHAVIGGLMPGEGNVIAGHLWNGVSISNTLTDVRVSGNSIHDNGALGIDLIDAGFQTGVSPNDALDSDIGGNGLQNFPVIQSAVRNGSNLNVTGILSSSPNNTFTIECFASPLCDDSGFGEGQVFLGATSVVTDSAGNAAFDATFSQTVAAGWLVTATATLEPIGATSEFSACMPIENGSMMGDLDGDGLVSVSDLFQLLAAWGSCGACPADLSHDGVVNVSDLFMLLSNWSS